MYECIYFISLFCIGISYLTSIMQTLSCVRKAKNVRAIRYCTGSIVVDTIRFLIFFTLYFNESFGTLYEYLYNNYDIYLLADLVFIVIVVSLYFVPTFIYDLRYVGIVPSDSYNNETYGEQPIGTGPYVLDHWDKGQQAIFKINDNYYGEKPYFTQITMLFATFKSFSKENTTLIVSMNVCS